MQETFLPTDRSDVPLGTEVDSDDAWTEFQLLSTQTMRVLAEESALSEGQGTATAVVTKPEADTQSDTETDTESDTESGADSGFASTASAPLSVDLEFSAPDERECSFEGVVAFARMGDRVCPKRYEWQQLYLLLRQQWVSGQSIPPPPPIEDTAWRNTSFAAKRMCLLAHIEWADNHGALEMVADYLHGLPDDRWLRQD
jgi:hypothetical protein